MPRLKLLPSRLFTGRHALLSQPRLFWKSVQVSNMMLRCALRAAGLAAQRLPAALASTPASAAGCAIGVRMLTATCAAGAPAAGLASELQRLAFLPVSVRALHGSALAAQQPAEDISVKDEPTEAKPQVRHDAGVEGAGKTYDEGYIAPHPGSANSQGPEVSADGSYMLMHPVYSKEYVLSIAPKHKKPASAMEWTGYWTVMAMRSSFDLITGYKPDKWMSAPRWLTRILFLETVAGVPGMVGGMLRHMRSLRTMQRDNGWIHTLLEEAENERMHLLTFLTLKEKNNLIFRSMVIGGQGVFFALYMLFYSLSARHCHAFVGYLEEEAVKTYTHLLKQIDAGALPEWAEKQAPAIARNYWKMPHEATIRDVVLAVRADEACHSHVNHTFSQLQLTDENPFSGKGSELVA